jgi:hypothetical protein
MNDMIKIKDDGYFFQPTEAAYTQSGNINDNDNLGFTG